MKLPITFLVLLFLCGMIYHVAENRKNTEQIKYDPASMYVIDGDTLVVAGEHIRLLDIDTPEIHGKCLSEKTRAYQAKGFVQGVLTTNRFRIIRKGKGKYGRSLADLWIDDKTLSSLLLNIKLARKYNGGRKPWCK